MRVLEGRARARSIVVTLAALLAGACVPESSSPPLSKPKHADAEVALPLDGGVAADASLSVEPDAIATAPDASPVEADAGFPPEDTGVVQIPPDSGAMGPTDTGVVTPADSGTVPPAPDAAPRPDAGFAADSGPDGGPRPPSDAGDPAPNSLNPGWIGGACSTAADCSYMDGICLGAADGYPGGTCSQSCTLTCPDQSGPLNSVTFCIDDGVGDGACVSRCDFTLSPTGCRAGYACLPERRMNQASVIRRACVPIAGVPGRPPPPFDIGAACAADTDCARGTCLTGLPAGYCTQESCDVVGCPSGSRCWNLGGQEEYYACLQDCTQSSQCRGADGYLCDVDATCWTAPPTSTGLCNLTGGAGDCSAWAAQASTDFVVVTKHLRRLTLCRGATAQGSYCAGLGSSPVGDKEREGDRRTPEGVFYIPRKIPNSSYYKAFLISYPDAADAQRGLAAGIITRSEHDAIVRAQAARSEPPQQTGLGGLVEIHGNGSGSDWTWGCVATEDTTIDRLWTAIDVGDTVVVLP